MQPTIDDPRAQVLRPATGQWRRRLTRAGFTLAIAFLLATIGLAIATRDHIRTLASLRRVPDTNMFVMDYYVDYNLDDIRRNGMDLSDVEGSLLRTFLPPVAMPVAKRLQDFFMPQSTYLPGYGVAHRCSTIRASTASGDVLLGRNFDWYHDACLILKIHGKQATSSVAVIDLHYLNLNRPDVDKLNLFLRIPLLFAPYYLMDGMNEHGLAVSDMAVDAARPPFDEAMPDVMHSTAMRLILDDARSVDEAIALLDGYNIHFVGPTCHLMIADAQGNSAVVEFVDGGLKIVQPDRDWQICTNHLLWDRTEEENEAACDRYALATDRLRSLGHLHDSADLDQIMAAVSEANWTMWTSVYNLSTGRFHVFYRRQFDRAYVDRLPKENHREVQP